MVAGTENTESLDNEEMNHLERATWHGIRKTSTLFFVESKLQEPKSKTCVKENEREFGSSRL